MKAKLRRSMLKALCDLLHKEALKEYFKAGGENKAPSLERLGQYLTTGKMAEDLTRAQKVWLLLAVSTGIALAFLDKDENELSELDKLWKGETK